MTFLMRLTPLHARVCCKTICTLSLLIAKSVSLTVSSLVCSDILHFFYITLLAQLFQPL